MAKIDYQKLHGGRKPPRGQVSYQQWYGPVSIIGEIATISYVADKGDGRGVQTYQHPFEKHGGRGPYLLKGEDGDSDNRLENPTKTHAEIGPIVDIVLTDGRRVVIGDAILSTDEAGDEVVIESEVGVPYQIEPRAGGHFVTERGIEE